VRLAKQSRLEEPWPVATLIGGCDASGAPWPAWVDATGLICPLCGALVASRERHEHWHISGHPANITPFVEESDD
jgi:hypothetical protein